MTSGIGDPWQNQPTLGGIHLARSKTKPRKESGDQASLGGMRTALGELEAAF
jgi:hypothetical protein